MQRWALGTRDTGGRELRWTEAAGDGGHAACRLSRMAAWQRPPQLLTLTEAKSRSPEMMGIRLLTAEEVEDCRCASSRHTCTVPDADAAHSHVPLCGAPGGGVGWGRGQRDGGVLLLRRRLGSGAGRGGAGGEGGAIGRSVLRSAVRCVAACVAACVAGCVAGRAAAHLLALPAQQHSGGEGEGADRRRE